MPVSPRKRRNRRGERTGRLVVLGRISSECSGISRFACRCDCGKVVVIWRSNLSQTQSCGCLQLERSVAANTTHGHWLNGKSSREMRTWVSMLNRCYYEPMPCYKAYGGRGIVVCDRWMTFENFVTDMGHRPVGTTLDRINSDGNYTPENCRWSTPIEQANNRKSNRRLSHAGRTQTVADWARELGFPPSTIQSRLVLGWSVDKALTTPVRGRTE